MFTKETLAQHGIINVNEVYRNLSPARLVEEAIRRGEGELSATGALSVNTGKYTGRSPGDRFVVETAETKDAVDWGKVNVPISAERYARIKARQQAYLEGRDVFVFDGFIGKDPKYRIAVRVINQYACLLYTSHSKRE